MVGMLRIKLRRVLGKGWRRREGRYLMSGQDNQVLIQSVILLKNSIDLVHRGVRDVHEEDLSGLCATDKIPKIVLQHGDRYHFHAKPTPQPSLQR